MQKRKYTHLQELLPKIEAMVAVGKSHREIEQYFGLTGDRPVHNLLKQERRRQKKAVCGTLPKPKGRPRKNGQLSQENEEAQLKRLRMENKLLRDFLQYTERK